MVSVPWAVNIRDGYNLEILKVILTNIMEVNIRYLGKIIKFCLWLVSFFELLLEIPNGLINTHLQMSHLSFANEFMTQLYSTAVKLAPHLQMSTHLQMNCNLFANEVHLHMICGKFGTHLQMSLILVLIYKLSSIYIWWVLYGLFDGRKNNSVAP